MILAAECRKQFEEAIKGRDGFEFSLRITGAKPAPIVQLVLRQGGRERAVVVGVTEAEIALRELLAVLNSYHVGLLERTNIGLIVRVVDVMQTLPEYTGSVSDIRQRLPGTEEGPLSALLATYAGRKQHVERVRKGRHRPNDRNAYRLLPEAIACPVCRERMNHHQAEVYVLKGGKDE